MTREGGKKKGMEPLGFRMIGLIKIDLLIGEKGDLRNVKTLRRNGVTTYIKKSY